LFIFPDQTKIHIGFTLKKDMFEQIKAVPVKVRVSFALTLFREKNRKEFVVPAGSLPLRVSGCALREKPMRSKSTAARQCDCQLFS